ncbi:MAG: hypothetical protein AAGH15_08915 [Myxococcota bacterium]
MTEGDVTTCDPYPAEGPDRCPAGQAHFPGEPGCTWLGRPCGEGRFADASDLGETPLVFVDAAVTAEGDGSAEAPFTTLAEGLGAASSGTTVMLASGDYEVDRPWPSGVSVRGRCARDTRLTTTTQPAIVSATNLVARVTLEDLTLGPADVPALVVRGEATMVSIHALRLTGTRAHDDAGGALTVQDNGTVSGEALVVRDTRARPSDGRFGVGLRVHRGGRLTLARTLVEANCTAGVVVGRSLAESPEAPGTPAGEVALSDAVVRDTRAVERDGSSGLGITVQFGARLRLERALLEGNRTLGILVRDAGSRATLTDVVVRDTRPQESDGSFGRALDVETGARLELTRGLVERNHDVGIFAFGAETNVELVDVVVRDTLPRQNDGTGGGGVGVQAGASLGITRGLVQSNREVGLLVAGAGTRVRLTDIVVRDTLAQSSDEASGLGLDVFDGAHLHLERALVQRNRSVGVSASGAETELDLVDVVVRDTLAQMGDGTLGRGLSAQSGAQLRLLRARVESNREVGLFAGAGTHVELADLVVRDTQARERDGVGGWGLSVELGARLRLERALLQGNREVSVFAGGSGTQVELADLVVRGTRARERDGVLGRGIVAQSGARLTLVRGDVNESVEAGIFASGAAELDLTDVRVTETRAPRCGSDCPVSVAPGTGVTVFAATAVFDRIAFQGSAACGVQIFGDSDLRLRNGLVEGHPIAVCLETSGYPLQRLTENVLYRDNDTRVEATRFEEPDVPTALALP